MPKRVDIDRYGGGFHLSKLWLKLFCDTLIFISYCNVDVLDIFKFINSCLDKKQIDYSYIKKELLECISYNSVIDNKYYKDIRIKNDTLIWICIECCEENCKDIELLNIYKKKYIFRKRGVV